MRVFPGHERLADAPGKKFVTRAYRSSVSAFPDGKFNNLPCAISICGRETYKAPAALDVMQDGA